MFLGICFVLCCFTEKSMKLSPMEDSLSASDHEVHGALLKSYGFRRFKGELDSGLVCVTNYFGKSFSLSVSSIKSGA